MPLDPELVAREAPGKCVLVRVSFYKDSPAGITSLVSLCGRRVLVRSLWPGAVVAGHEGEACGMSALCRVETGVVARPRVSFFFKTDLMAPPGSREFLVSVGGVDPFRFRRMSVQGSRLS